MTQELFEEVRDAIIKVKGFGQLPKSAITHAIETESLKCLALIRDYQLEFYEFITYPYIAKALDLFRVTEQGDIELGFERYNDLSSRLFSLQPPEIAVYELSVHEINKVLTKLNEGRHALYGGLSELQGVKRVYDDVYSTCESIYKALAMSKLEWEGESTFQLVVDPQFIISRLKVNELVEAYQTRLAWYNSTYEVISRIITLNLSEPDDLTRGSVHSENQPSWKKKRGNDKEVSS